MGSVPILTTSGDNDPVIEPVQSFRHFLYCDACGSFELDPWTLVDPAPVERRRKWLGAVARYALAFVAVPAWRAAGWVPSLSVLVLVAMGVAFMEVLRGWWFVALRASGEVGAHWRFVLGVARWWLLLVAAEGLAGWLPDGWIALGGVLVAVGALVWRSALASRIESVGVRCRRCAATYRHGTPFFADLDANPRGLSEADVPRPSQGLRVLQGRYVGPAPADPPSRLPR